MNLPFFKELCTSSDTKAYFAYGFPLLVSQNYGSRSMMLPRIACLLFRGEAYKKVRLC